VINPKAKASIVWVVGEYVEVVQQYAPDILRQLAKQFATGVAPCYCCLFFYI
jgi:hypothetical protein